MDHPAKTIFQVKLLIPLLVLIIVFFGTYIYFQNSNVNTDTKKENPTTEKSSDNQGDNPETKNYTLIYTAGEHGTISGNLTQTVKEGEDGEVVTAIANDGYHFTTWSDNNSTTASRTDTDIKGDITTTALFEQNSVSDVVQKSSSSPTVAVPAPAPEPVINTKTYNLVYLAGEHGSISGLSTQTVNHGASGQAVTAVAENGYIFVRWSDNYLLESRTDYNVTSDNTYTAIFTLNAYVINATSGTGGTITPSGETNKDYGSSQSYQIEANEGYKIADVLVDGESVGAVDIYQFPNIGNNHTIEASFETIPISIVSVSSITPSSGYDTKSITIDSIEGTGFRPGASVKLTRSGEEDINCTNVVFESSSLISNALCDITSKEAEDWNVVVTNSDTGVGELQNGFEVKEYEVGEVGPLGGYIFYVNLNAQSDGWKYMEAAPVDQADGTFKKWWSNTTTLIGGTGTGIGSGWSNTNAIVNGSSPDNTSAIGLAYNYTLNGYTDWFLPSRDELDLMYTNLHIHTPNPLGGFGGIDGSSYWSSSEIDKDNAYRQIFDTGVISSSDKDSTRRIRAVRRFTTCPTYSISYNGNENTGGEVPTDSSPYLTGSSVTVLSENPENPLTKSGGYTFAGWNTAPDGSGTNYSAGATLTMPANDIVLYAKWYIPNYTIAILPDTQSYVNWKPGVIDTQLTWLAGNKSRLNLKFVAHVGDIVQNWETNPKLKSWDTSQNEWPFVQSQMGKLTTAGIPFSTLPGNHDYGYMTRTSTVYNTYFPLSNFSSMSTYGGAYNTNSDNTYHIVQVDADNNGSVDDRLLILSLEFGPRAEVVSWANGVLATHAQTRAIIITHAYLNPSGELLTSGMNHAASNGYGLGGDVYDGDELWASLVEPNDNVRYVFCGHDGVETDGSALRTSHHDGDEAKPVYQIMTNYQYYPVNEAGYLVLLNFNSTGVSMKTYSPWLDEYKTDSESQASWTWSF